jgi:MFS family permease
VKPKNIWLTRNLIVLSLISLMQDAASEIMYPLMPLFLTGVLAAPAIVLGAVEGCAEVAMGVSKYFAGKASDSRGRKPFITAGYGLAGVGKILVASSVIWPTVLLGRVIDRLGKGIRSAPRDAMITNSVEPEHYSRAYGFHRSADTLGAVIGPVIALIGLSVLNGNIRAVMWWAIVPAVLSIGLTFFIKEVKQPRTENPKSLTTKLKLPNSFWATSVPFILFALTNLPDTLLLLRLFQLGTSTTHVVLAYIAFNIVYTLAAYPAGILAENISPHKIYAIGLAAFAVSYVTLGQLSRPGILMYLVVALYGFFPALTDGIGKSMVSSVVPKQSHGRAQGIFQSLSGFAILFAGLWAGALWGAGKGSGSAPMTIAGLAAGVMAIGFFVLGKSPHLTELAIEESMPSE